MLECVGRQWSSASELKLKRDSGPHKSMVGDLILEEFDGVEKGASLAMQLCEGPSGERNKEPVNGREGIGALIEVGGFGYADLGEILESSPPCGLQSMSSRVVCVSTWKLAGGVGEGVLKVQGVCEVQIPCNPKRIDKRISASCIGIASDALVDSVSQLIVHVMIVHVPENKTVSLFCAGMARYPALSNVLMLNVALAREKLPSEQRGNSPSPVVHSGVEVPEPFLRKKIQDPAEVHKGAMNLLQRKDINARKCPSEVCHLLSHLLFVAAAECSGVPRRNGETRKGALAIRRASPAKPPTAIAH